MKLLVDVGNTAIKFAWVKNQKIIKQTILDSEKILKPRVIIKKLQFQKQTFETIVYCSVKPIWNKALHQLGRKINVHVINIRDSQSLNEFKVNVSDVSKVGSDLLIGAYGANQKYPNHDLIILSFGTATTITMIKNNAFEGAIIMPGLKVSAQNLFKRAALLEPFNFKYSSKIIGKNTKEAINLGVVNGHLWGVKGLIDQIKTQLKSPLILITGGNNYHYQAFFENYYLEPNLVFEGMIKLV